MEGVHVTWQGRKHEEIQKSGLLIFGTTSYVRTAGVLMGGGVGGTSDDLTTFHLAPPLKGPPSLRGPGT